MRIIKTIRDVLKNNPILFTTPGHARGVHIIDEFTQTFGRGLFNADLSEIEGMDNFHNPIGAILQSLQRTSEIYGSEASFYLVNGSSSGIIALMIATVKRGEKVLIARNAHKSLINALVISGAHPVWVETEWDENWHIPSVVNPQKIAEKLDENPDIQALWITSPTYEGIITDIRSIAEICAVRKVILLVDEAHGALWNFSERLADSSIHLGADACVQSLHKTGSCLNQGAVLHISKGSKINPQKVQQCLNLINTTSPSYILLASIESSVEYLNSKQGREKLNNLINNIEQMKAQLKANSDVVFLENTSYYRHDPTKIFFGIKDVSGYKLSDFLQDKFNIEVEMNNSKGLLALCGIGTTKENLDKLSEAVIKAGKELNRTTENENPTPFIVSEIAITPAQAFFSEFKKVKTCESAGMISKETIVNYPPGIPLIIAGELIQESHMEVLKDRQEIEVII